MTQKYIIDKEDLPKLIKGEALALDNGYAFSVEVNETLTNGDVIKAVFPSAEIDENKYTYVVCVKLPYHTQYDTGLLFDKDWWNAPYKAESEDKG